MDVLSWKSVVVVAEQSHVEVLLLSVNRSVGLKARSVLSLSFFIGNEEEKF